MFAQQLTNGLMVGSTYALLAMGYTLVLGLLKMLNIAHGDVFMVGAFIGLSAAIAGLPLPAALAVAAIGAGAVGVVVERLCFRPFGKSQFLSPMLSTIAFGIMLQNVATQVWGADPSRYPQVDDLVQFHIGPVVVSSVQAVILGVSLVLMIGIDQFVSRTSLGRAIRATAINANTASLLGVDVKRIVVVTFFTSGALAGVAGVLTALAYSQITPFIGIRQGLIGMVAMVLGGLGNLRGAMLGGLLIGIVEVMNDAYFDASYRDMIVFSLFFVVLILRPEGLFGEAK